MPSKKAVTPEQLKQIHLDAREKSKREPCLRDWKRKMRSEIVKGIDRAHRKNGTY